MSQLIQKPSHLMQDNLRPSYHFLPPKNWMNDPNGIIFWKGHYHLFYQYNPNAAVWGDIHWGHAKSPDLVHWEDLPIALAPSPNSPDERGIWSGCTVAYQGKVYAFYTGARGENHQEQSLCLAMSQDDDLVNWEKYPQNPLIEKAPAEFSGCGFRDPYIFREGNLWKMVIGAGKVDGAEAVLLYQSSDLLNWNYIAPLILSDAHNNDVYECPNFFPLGDKWVLLVSVMSAARVDYFVGLFWQNHFIIETQGTIAEAPFFAPYSFEDDKGRRLMLAWLREMRPQAEYQEAAWAGTMSLPLELMLLENNQVAITPVREILDIELTGHYRQYENVQDADLAKIQTEMGNQLKLVISDDLSKLVFLDGSVIEYFDFPHYSARRVYDGYALDCLSDFVDFPIKRLSVWTMPRLR